MPRFLYKAKKGPTEIVQGEIDAEDEDSALAKIGAMGLIPMKLVPWSQVPAKGKKGDGPQGTVLPRSTPGVSGPSPGGPSPKVDKQKIRIPHRDLNVFTRQFAILLRANVPLLRSFQVLQLQTENVKFRAVLGEIQDSLRQGGSISEVLSEYPRIFSTVYTSMIHSGEVSGTLDKVLIRLAEFAEQQAEIRSRVQSALIYPLVLLLVGLATIFVLLAFVMPRLMIVFEDLGTELPRITQIMISISRFCEAQWIWIVGGAAALGLWVRSIGISKAQKRLLDAAALKLPVIGELVRKTETAKFLRTMELLYENGIPLFKAVDVAARTVTNVLIREELEKVPKHLEGGETLANSLERVPYMTSFVTSMVSVGEESGQLGTAVSETSLFYEQESGQFVKIALSLLEPLMILGIGLVIGFIVISMLLPIFEISALAS